MDAKQYDGVIKFVHLYPNNAQQTKQSTENSIFIKWLNQVFGVKKFKDHQNNYNLLSFT